MARTKALAKIAATRGEVVALGGGLEGADRTSRETMLWSPSRLSADQIINRVKEEADARGRDMVSNDGYSQGIVDINRDNIVGSQYRLNAQPNWQVLQTIDRRFDETWADEFQVAVEEKFNLIAESNNCWLDASRRMTFTGMVRLAISGFVYTGESLSTCEWIREVDRPFYTAIQMISPSRLSNPQGAMDDRNLRRGIRRDARGKHLGFWIRRSHPTEFFDIGFQQSDLIPASKPWGRKMVIYVNDPLEPGQTRGISGMVATLKEMRMTKKFQEIVLQNAVINASYAATMESELPSEIIAAALGGGATADVGAGYFSFLGDYMNTLKEYLSEANSVAVDGAKIPHFFPGTKLNVQTLGTPGGVGTDFETSLLRHIAAGLGISYEEFARDFSRTNYSSARASMLTTRKHMMARKRFVADRFADEVFCLWLEEDLADGGLPMPNGSDMFYQPWGKECLSACEWIGAGYGQIDELKETQASLLRVRGGLSTREFEIARMGQDWRKIYRQLARENRLAEELGLSFETDPSKDGSQNTQTLNDPNQDGQNADGQNANNTNGSEAEAELELEPELPLAIQAPPPPIINVYVGGSKKKTVVTKHDDLGRILEFEQEEIADG